MTVIPMPERSGGEEGDSKPESGYRKALREYHAQAEDTEG